MQFWQPIFSNSCAAQLHAEAKAIWNGELQQQFQETAIGHVFFTLQGKNSMPTALFRQFLHDFRNIDALVNSAGIITRIAEIAGESITFVSAPINFSLN